MSVSDNKRKERKAWWGKGKGKGCLPFLEPQCHPVATVSENPRQQQICLLLGTGVSKDVLDCLGSAQARVSHSKGQRPRGKCACQWGHIVVAGAPEMPGHSRQPHNQTSQGTELPSQPFWGGRRRSNTPLTVEDKEHFLWYPLRGVPGCPAWGHAGNRRSLSSLGAEAL